MKIKRIELKNGSVRWRFVVDMGKRPDGRRDQRTITCLTQKEARAAAAKIVSDRARGTLVRPTNVTVATACDAWLAGRRNLRPNTHRTYADALALVTSRVGHIRLSELTKRHLDEMTTDLLENGRRRGGKLSPRSVNLCLTLLGSVCEDAVRQGQLGRNVARLVERPAERKRTTTTWTPEHATRFLAAVRDSREDAAWQLALFGLRRSEVLGLRWHDVDLSAGTLTIGWARTAIAGRPHEGPPKTVQSARTLPLDAQLMAALTALRIQQMEESATAGPAYAGPCELCDGHHVVVDALGRPWLPALFAARFARAVANAGVPKIRLHDARHTCGSIMHARGVPIAAISAWLGHARSSFTMDRYVHSQDGALTAAAGALRDAVTDANVTHQ